MPYQLPATGRQPAGLQPGVLADKILDDAGAPSVLMPLVTGRLGR